jgi:hypothetical protein
MTLRHRIVLITAALVSSGQGLLAGYSPTITEINLGPVPLDVYMSSSTNGTLGTLLPTCPTSYTIRNCYKLFFNNNSGISPYTSGNYVGQGVTGVRFLFSMASGGWYSTPWDAYGNVSSTWTSNLTTFLSDLYSYGIVRITPTLGLDGWGGTPITPSPAVYDCTNSYALVFFPWMPFGHLASSHNTPDCQDVNDAYSSANANPYFWGWTPLFNLVDAIFGAVSSSSLALAEFDIYNEMNILDFTIYGRLFYDNVHDSAGGSGTTDVLGTLRSSASYYGLNEYAITASTPSDNPTSSGYDCGSVYGDSALIVKESELTGALAGSYSAFGFPAGATTSSHLWCGGSATGMISLPVYYSQPSVTDIHMSPCVITSGVCDTTIDVTTTATTAYSDVWAFLYYRSLTSNVAMIGETYGNVACDGYTTTMASENVSGYEASNLFSNHAAGTTLRPWNNDTVSCYSTPASINPPYAQ